MNNERLLESTSEKQRVIHTASSLLGQWIDTCATRREGIAQLLSSTLSHLASRGADKRQRIIALLKKAQPYIEKIGRNNQESAPHFNVFDALGIARKEVVHSSFLAYLLSPSERHNQSAKFLNSFLKAVDIPEVAENEATLVRVVTEHTAGTGPDGLDLGRMDIVIFAPNSLIVVENKIDAGEGSAQLARYQAWMKMQKRYAQNGREKYLIFLTPTGHESVTGKISTYLPMSYSDLADAVAAVHQENILPEALRSVIAQYISTCRLIGESNMVIQDTELQELLTNPMHVRAALEIEQQAQLARKRIAKEFAENVAKILQKRVSTDPVIAQKWKVVSTFEDGPAHVEIRTFRHSIKQNYQLRADSVFTTNGRGTLGWYRPTWIDLKGPSPDTATLTEKMIHGDCTVGAEGWWVASTPLRGGRRGYLLSNNEDVINCLTDNRAENHPMATQIADEMWEMFSAYYLDIEALPSFNSAIDPVAIC